MKQKIIKIGNSVGIILSRTIRDKSGLKLGDSINVEYNSQDNSVVVNKKGSKKTTSSITPRFLRIVEKVNKQYASAFRELADK